MSNKTLKIKDFELFMETIQPISKIAKSAKISVDEFGTGISVKNELCRCSIRSDSVSADEKIEFCIGDLGMLIKVMSTVNSIHEGDFSNVKLFVDGSFFRIESNRFKTKISLVHEDDVEKYLDRGFNTPVENLEYGWEVITNSNMIKRLNSQSFMFSDSNSVRAYLGHDPTMSNNTMHARIGCDGDDFENSVTFEFGMVTSGKIEDEVILNFERLNLINILQSDEIKVRKLSNRQTLVVMVKKTGKNGAYLNLSMVMSGLVK